jgi:hypothetical protein
LNNMTRFLSLLLLLAVFSTSKAQISATTQTGRRVILFNDGTWKYSADTAVNKSHPDSVKLNPEKFSKSAGATFLVKSNVNSAAVFIDPEKWTMKTHHDNETNPEYRFSAKSENGFAMIITEKMQIDLQNMPSIALTNAQKASIDAAIIKQEYRTVNYKKVLYLELSGTIKGIKFRYMGYYYSNEKGTTQLVSYTSDTLYKQASKEMETFLNGFVILD